MLQEITFSPATIIVAAVIVAWLIWAIRRLTRRGLCDCHGDGKKRGAGRTSCSHCAAGCPAAAMAERLEDLAETPPR